MILGARKTNKCLIYIHIHIHIHNNKLVQDMKKVESNDIIFGSDNPSCTFLFNYNDEIDPRLGVYCGAMYVAATEDIVRKFQFHHMLLYIRNILASSGFCSS